MKSGSNDGFVVNTVLTIKDGEAIRTFVVQAEGDTLGELLKTATVSSKSGGWRTPLMHLRGFPVYVHAIDLLQTVYVKGSTQGSGNIFH